MDTAIAMLLGLAALTVVTAVAPVLFPRFRDVVEPLAGMTIATATLRWGFFHAVALSSRRQQWRIIPCAAVGIVVTAAWTYAAVRLDWAFVYLSLAPAVGAAVYSVATVVVYEQTTADGRAAMRWTAASLRHMLVLLVAELPLLALRGARPWYSNTMLALASLVLLVTMLIIFDRRTGRTLGGLMGAMVHGLPLLRGLMTGRRSRSEAVG